MRNLWLFVLFVVSPSHAVSDDWFMATPLQSTYRALANHQPQLAWQELILALNNQTIATQHWASVKNAIIEQTQCGQQLLSDVVPNAALIKVSIQKKTNVMQQGYQFKLSMEGAELPSQVELLGPDNGLLISQSQVTSSAPYIELESPELLFAPQDGVYRLTLDKQHYWLVLTMPFGSTWLQSASPNGGYPLALESPTALTNCPPTSLAWQWFDDQFQLIKQQDMVAISNTQQLLNKPSSSPSSAKWLSTLIKTVEYQGAIKVEYVQRLTLPNQAQ